MEGAMDLNAVCTVVAHEWWEEVYLGGKRGAGIMFLNCFSWEGAWGSTSHRENLVLTLSQHQPCKGAAVMEQT